MPNTYWLRIEEYKG